MPVCACLYVCICEQNISKSIQGINFICGGSFTSDTGEEIDFEKKTPHGKGLCLCVCVCVGGGGSESLAQ